MHKLVRVRKKHKLTGASVARESKIDRSYYRYVELGKYIPSADVATRISNAISKLTSGLGSISPSDIIFANYKTRAKSRTAKKAA